MEALQAAGLPAGEDDGLLSIPGLIVSHDLGMQGDIMGRELGQFVGLSVDPAQRLHVLRERAHNSRSRYTHYTALAPPTHTP